MSTLAASHYQSFLIGWSITFATEDGFLFKTKCVVAVVVFVVVVVVVVDIVVAVVDIVVIVVVVVVVVVAVVVDSN